MFLGDCFSAAQFLALLLAAVFRLKYDGRSTDVTNGLELAPGDRCICEASFTSINIQIIKELTDFLSNFCFLFAHVVLKSSESEFYSDAY